MGVGFTHPHLLSYTYTMWTKPWSYREGSAIALGLIIVGLMLQYSVGPLEWKIFMWPANLIVLAVFVLFVIVTYALRKRVYAFRFMMSVQAAVPALATAALLTVIMGLTKQVAEGKPAADPIGLSKMLNFWPFVLVYVWMTVIVGEVMLHQLTHLNKKGIPSLISHAGLFLVLTTATLGSADMQRTKMYCELGKPEWRVLDERQDVKELPLAIELNRFTIDEYPPKLMVIDDKGLPLPTKKPAHILIDKDFKGEKLLGWDIRIVKRIDHAVPAMMAKMVGNMPGEMVGRMRMDSLGQVMNKGGYISFEGKGAQCALLVRATKGGKTTEGWVTCGSYQFPYQGLELDKHHTIVMPNREPARFASDVTIFTKEGEHIDATIEVNKPFAIAGWKVYQLSYNEQMGKWSNLSVFELVRDPWLPAVYFGIYMILIGAVLMFIQAATNKQN